MKLCTPYIQTRERSLTTFYPEIQLLKGDTRMDLALKILKFNLFLFINGLPWCYSKNKLLSRNLNITFLFFYAFS